MLVQLPVAGYDIHCVQLANVAAVTAKQITGQYTLQCSKAESIVRIPLENESIEPVAQPANSIVKQQVRHILSRSNREPGYVCRHIITNCHYRFNIGLTLMNTPHEQTGQYAAVNGLKLYGFVA
jgi:hypothetical protein